jgi:hypothetical protein
MINDKVREAYRYIAYAATVITHEGVQLSTPDELIVAAHRIAMSDAPLMARAVLATQPTNAKVVASLMLLTGRDFQP